MNSRSASIVGDQEAAGSSSYAWCNRQWLSSQALTRRSSVRPKQAVFNHNLLWLPESNGYPLHAFSWRGMGGRGLLCWVFNRFQHSKIAGQFLAKEARRSERPSLLYWNLSVSPRTVTKLRISIVQYLNTAPLVWGFTNGPLRGKYDLSFTVPSQCAEDLRSGRADVAIIPAIEYQRIDDLVILQDMAIASKRQVRSLLVIAKKPIEQVKSFALDAGSRSTQTLTRILCAEKWKIAPQFFESPPDLPAMLQQADAALIIGDPALRISVGIEKESRPVTEG